MPPRGDETSGSGSWTSRCSLLAGLSEPTRQPLEQLATARELLAGTCLFALGEAATSLHFLDEGGLALKMPLQPEAGSRELTLHQVAAPAVIGWSALVAPYKYTLSAWVTSDARVVSLGRDELERALASELEEQATLYRNLTQILSGRLTQLQVVMMRSLQRWVAPPRPAP